MFQRIGPRPSFSSTGRGLDPGRRFSVSFLRSGSRIITAAVLNASAPCDALSCGGTLLRLTCLPHGSDLDPALLDCGGGKGISKKLCGNGSFELARSWPA